MAVKKGVAFFEGNSWFHRIKVLRADGSTNYTKKGGFSSAEEAEQSYFLCEEEYKKACRAYQMSRKVDVDIGLGDYLKYWMEDVYTPRVQNTTRMIAAYVLYNLILPALEQDIKLKYVNAEFLGALLERVAVATESASTLPSTILEKPTIPAPKAVSCVANSVMSDLPNKNELI